MGSLLPPDWGAFTWVQKAIWVVVFAAIVIPAWFGAHAFMEWIVPNGR